MRMIELNLYNFASLCKVETMNQLKGVSVIICCYNSEKRITPTLEHLQKISQVEISWELVLVDNNSKDQTRKIAAEVWDMNPVTQLKIAEEKTPGLMHARQKGVSVSTYEIVSFIDDDNWVDEGWIENVYRIFKNDATIGACGGESIAVFENEPPGWFTQFQNSFAVGRQQDETGYVDDGKGYLWGAGLSIRKNAWLELFSSGFTSRLSGRKGSALTAGEDSEICLALIRRGWKLWYDSSLKLRHFIPAVRLSDDYLIKMYKGFGKAEMILSIYRHSVKHPGRNPLWIIQVLHALKLLCRSGLKSIFSSTNNKFTNYVMLVHDKAYLSELMLNRSAYYHTLRTIRKEIKNPLP